MITLNPHKHGQPYEAETVRRCGEDYKIFRCPGCQYPVDQVKIKKAG